MLTLLTSAKSLSGVCGKIPRTAFENWRRSCPNAEIVFFGGDKGGDAFCKELGIKRVAVVKATEMGVPLFTSVVDWARTNAQYELQVYLNADILLPPDFCDYVKKAPSSAFLMVGQRVDLIKGVLFSPDGFYEQLRHVLQAGQAEVHRPSGMDFFVFRRGQWQGLKPLIVGRGGYDSALVTYCLRRGIPVIDASFAFPVVHQWHDYSHVQEGKRQSHYGIEAQFNFETHGLRDFSPNCIDAELIMTGKGNIITNHRRSLLRRMELELYYRRGWKKCPRFNQLWNILTRGGVRIRQPNWGDGMGKLMHGPL